MRKEFLLTTTVISIGISVIVLQARHITYLFKTHQYSMNLTPWASIGGCGVSGGAGSGGSSATWVGRGVSGSLLDCEIRGAFLPVIDPGTGEGRGLVFSVPLQLAYHLKSSVVLLSIPLQYKTMTIEGYASGGSGDLSFTFQKSIGSNGNGQVTTGMWLPTGKSSMYNNQNVLLPSNMQNGSGVAGFSLGYDHTIDRDDWLIILGGSYSLGMFYLKGTEFKFDNENGYSIAEKRKLTFARNKWGYINDAGFTQPDNIDIHGNIGMKLDKIVHSLGFRTSIPTRDAQYTEFNYDNRIRVTPELNSLDAIKAYYSTVNDSNDVSKRLFAHDDSTSFDIGGIFVNPFTGDSSWIIRKRTIQNDKRWLITTLNYGMEFSNVVTPVFWAVSVSVEWDTQDGVGINGFATEMGIKFNVY